MADGLRRHADIWAVMGLTTDFWKTEFWRGIAPVVEGLGWTTFAEFQQNSKLALIWVSNELRSAAAGRSHQQRVCPGFVPATAAQYTRRLVRVSDAPDSCRGCRSR